MRPFRLHYLWLCCLCAGLVNFTAATASAVDEDDTVGTNGMRHLFTIDGIVGRGSRLQSRKPDVTGSGNQYVVRAEGGAFFLATPLGNMGGVEGGAEVGVDSIPYAERDNLLYGAGALIDAWVGFPVTLLNLNKKGSRDWLRIAATPGIGASLVSAYTYLKLRGAMRITDGLTGELTYIWWPDAASYPFGHGNNDPVNEASLRAAVFMGDTGDKGSALHGYIEVHNGQRTSENNSAAGDKKLFAGQVPFAPVERWDYETFWRVGVGYAF